MRPTETFLPVSRPSRAARRKAVLMSVSTAPAMGHHPGATLEVRKSSGDSASSAVNFDYLTDIGLRQDFADAQFRLAMNHCMQTEVSQSGI